MRLPGALKTALLILGAFFITLQVCWAFPRPPMIVQPDPSQPDQSVDYMREPPPDPCRRGLCENKGKICQVICKNNPSEGGKFCNCDTYALRAHTPCYTDCNRLF